MALSDQVRRARREILGLTQRELASELGVDQVNVSRWERGVAEPKMQTLRLLSQISGQPVSWFFEDNTNGKAA